MLLAQLGLTWYLLPLAGVISLVYSATRYESPARIVQRGAKLFLQVLFFMAVILGILMALSLNL
jgi:hypothetical protein